MSESALFRHLLRHLFPYYYVKFEKLESDFGSIEPFVAKGALTDNLFDIITKAIYGLEEFIVPSWKNFLKELDILSIKCPKVYILQVIVFSVGLNYVINDIYERFIIVCALVTVIGIHTSNNTSKNYYKLTPLILTVLFEKLLRNDFKKRGGWKRLEKYLTSQDYLQLFEMVNKSSNLSTVLASDALAEVMDFIMRREFMYSPKILIEKGTENSEFAALNSEVLLMVEDTLLTELSQSSENEPATVPSPADECLPEHLSKLTLREEVSLEMGGKSKKSPKTFVDIKDFPYESSIENQLLILQKLQESNLNREGSNLGESLGSAFQDLIKGLERLKLKIECAVSLL